MTLSIMTYSKSMECLLDQCCNAEYGFSFFAMLSAIVQDITVLSVVLNFVVHNATKSLY